MVRELKATKTTGGIKVAFKAGEYGALDNLTFTPEDAGTAECPITYCKYGDGDVVFRNGMHIAENEFKPLTDDEKTMFPEKAWDGIKKVDLKGRVDVMNEDVLLFGGAGTFTSSCCSVPSLVKVIGATEKPQNLQISSNFAFSGKLLMMLHAIPFRLARPVRPTRWT